MDKFTSKSAKAAPKAVPVPPMGGRAKGSLPARGERTETNKRTSDARHPQSHDEFEKLGQ